MPLRSSKNCWQPSSRNFRHQPIGKIKVWLIKSTNGWAFGNILIGGLIGWGIDLGTNCVSKPAQTHFYINANDVQEQPAQQQNNYINVGTGVEAP